MARNNAGDLLPRRGDFGYLDISVGLLEAVSVTFLRLAGFLEFFGDLEFGFCVVVGDGLVSEFCRSSRLALWDSGTQVSQIVSGFGDGRLSVDPERGY